MNDVKLFKDGNPDVQVTEEEFVKTLEEVIKKGKEALEEARKMPNYNKRNRYERSMRYWNVEAIMNQLELAERQIEQNGNAKIIFFDLCLQMIVLIKKPKRQ